MIRVFDIKRYAINDGPGIRTTIFFSGCPLRCVWCHNPESWDPRPHLIYKKNKCIGCATCVSVCPQHALSLTPNGIIHNPTCTIPNCSTPNAKSIVSPSGDEGGALWGAPPPCISSCPTLALEICGREWSLDELMTEIEKERDIMTDSGGGVTLCGGEPLLQSEAALTVLEELGRRRLHRAVDTTLYASEELITKTARHCELFLVDLKIMDDELHRRFTGVSNERILRNLRLLSTLDTDFQIRIPLIEGINADEGNIEATASFLDTLPSKKGLRAVNLLPYHDVGRDKHRRLWSQYNPDNLPMAVPSDETLQRCVNQFAAHGYHAIIGG